MKTFAQKKRLPLSLWAFGFSSVFIGSCKPKVPKPPVQEKVAEPNLLNASLKRLASGCPNEKKTTVYAHFIGQTMNDALCIEDVINNPSTEMNCSPGPYPAESNYSDSKNAKWNLRATPDYFVWHIRNATGLDIYLKNQVGMPIKSQVVHLKNLQNADDATLVLLPKVALDEGSTYYLYLTQNENNEKQTWVQPLSIGSKAQ